MVVVAIVAVFTVPYAHEYSFGTSGSPGLDESGVFAGSEKLTLCPSGASVSLTYGTTGSIVATFKATDPSGHTFWTTSTNGSTAFTVTCGDYVFSWSGEGEGTLSYVGEMSWNGPLLSV